MKINNFEHFIKGKIISGVVSNLYGERYSGDKTTIAIGDGDHDGGEVRINFTDGTYIVAAASEWGHISYFGKPDESR